MKRIVCGKQMISVGITQGAGATTDSQACGIHTRSWNERGSRSITIQCHQPQVCWRHHGHSFTSQYITDSSAPLPMASLSMASVTHGQPQTTNTKWKIPETNNSYVVNCQSFWKAWCNLEPFLSILPRTSLCWACPCYQCCPATGHPLGYQINYCSIPVLA